NMAVIMAGDLDPDRTIALIDKYFGSWIPVAVPEFEPPQEVPLTAPVQVEVFGPMAGWVDIAWRLDGTGTDDEVMAALVGRMLSNGQAGIIDLDLLQQQKVLNAYAYGRTMHDHGMLQMHGQARQGQSLEEVRDLLLEQVAKLARGEFEDWLIEAVVNDLRQSRTRGWSDSNRARTSAFTDAFITRKSWAEVLDFHDRMARVTKQQVMDFAQRKLGAGRVELFKRTGENRDTYKVPKPSITPVEINRDVQSRWRTEWERMPKGDVQPVFIDFDTAIDRSELKSGVPLAHITNTSNDIFSLSYIADLGTLNDPLMDLAVRYLEFLGTGRQSARDLKQEFFKLGLRFGVDVGEDRAYVSLSGLEQNLEQGVQLLERLLADPRADEAALIALVHDIGKERQDRLKNKSYILHTGLYSYARYGPRSPLTDALSLDSMRVVPAAALIDRIKGLTGHEHRVFYYGSKPAAEVKAVLDKLHEVPARLKPVPPARHYAEQPTTTDRVYFLDHDMVQTDLLLVSKAGPFDPAVLPYASLFNEYFGAGLSSIVFQEIREAKALAYSASAFYTTPARADQAHYVRAFVGTQADKLTDAVDALLKLMNDMPQAAEQFAGSKEAARKVIASERITKAGIYWNWEALQRLGLDHDIRKDRYEQVPGITMARMKDFFDREIKGRHYTYLVIGKESHIDFKALERLGPVTKLTKKEVFGYDEE
ncbi:MAG: insulinase family protein, partial [Flavobacteriales bacterium]|nr:insulinase family protein [Flavobacteriales bacterium]